MQLFSDFFFEFSRFPIWAPVNLFVNLVLRTRDVLLYYYYTIDLYISCFSLRFKTQSRRGQRYASFTPHRDDILVFHEALCGPCLSECDLQPGAGGGAHRGRHRCAAAHEGGQR